MDSAHVLLDHQDHHFSTREERQRNKVLRDDARRQLHKQLSRPSGAGTVIVAKEDKATLAHLARHAPFIVKADEELVMSPYFGYYPPGSNSPEVVIIAQDEEVLQDAAKWPVWQRTRAPRRAKVEIKAVDGKGLAMMAAKNIEKGEVIHTER